MASISTISERFCDWRSHLGKGDSIQAYDGRGWFAATIHSIKINQKTNIKRLLVGYDNYSDHYDFWCPCITKQIRPTIGFLRKKIMVPQAKEIKSLQNEIEILKEENKELKLFKSKYIEKEYEYLPLKRLSSNNCDDSSINDKEVCDQAEIEDILMDNVKILSEWNKITKELNVINNELNEIVCDSQNENYLNIKDLVRIQTMIEKRIEIQQQRLESSQNNIIIPVMTQKFKIDNKINKYQATLKNINDENYENAEKYKIIQNDCIQLINSLRDLNLYCNQKINEENILNDEQSKYKDEMYTLQNYINQYTEYSSSYFNLLKGFQKFQVLNQDYILNSFKQINFGWKKMESLWYKWQSDDILLWIQYIMNWMNKNIVPKCLNFDTILQNMERKQINGMLLLKLKKIDLLHIGFTMNYHRTVIYQHIKALITKNKMPNNDDVSNENDKQNMSNDDRDNYNDTNCEEGEQITKDLRTNDGNNIIPAKYKCSLTNLLMYEPVICGHNNKLFEKSAIYTYVNEYGKLPLVNDDVAVISKIDINDDASFLLFDDLSLKIEIEQFRQEHNL